MKIIMLKRKFPGLISNSLLILFIIILILSSSACKNKTDNSADSNPANQEGLCIYLTDIPEPYTQKDRVIDVNKVNTVGKALIAYKDIINYDTASHTISLSYPLESLKIKRNVYGVPFLITLGGEKIYGGWFWTSISSIPCSWVVVLLDYPGYDFSNNLLTLQLGYPTSDFFIGNDPRKNAKIMNRLRSDGKIK